MNAYHKYKTSLEQFLQTEKGKRLINFTYSIGAAIVLLGVMFKLLHFPFGNQMLFIGILTEVIVFILSAFDTPIRDYRWEQVFPELYPTNAGNTVNAPGFTSGAGVQPKGTSAETGSGDEKIRERKSLVTAPINQGTTHPFTEHSIGRTIVSEFDKLPHLMTYSEEYSRQMENLNSTLSGLNSIYEIQLKSVSTQISSIEQINRGLARLQNMYGENLPDGTVIKNEIEKMAEQLKELNQVYARMIDAMTMNHPAKEDRANNL